MRLPAALAATCAFLALAPAAIAATDPADQPPLGGEPIPRLIERAPSQQPPAGFSLSPDRARAIANRAPEAEPELRTEIGTRGTDRWQVSYFDSGGTEKARIAIDDRTGDIVEALTGHAVETPLARGYPGAVAGIANNWWIWIPLCVLFVAPFFDPRRPFRLLHLDLLVLLSFGISQYFFNRGDIDISVPLVYPVLAYVFARMLFVGFTRDGDRERRQSLIPHVPNWALIAAIVALSAFRIGVNLSEDNVIDVGYAGVIGADRISQGEDLYDEEYWSTTQVRGDTYGTVNYLAYLPFEALFPWSGEWDDLGAARAASIAFDLLTALGLLLLGFRVRPGPEGRRLGLALCFAWMAYPYTLYTLDSSFNDALVSLGLVAVLLSFSSAAGRGAVTAIAGFAKFGPLALAPLFAAGDGRRRWRDIAVFSAVFAVVAAVVVLPLLPDGGFKELYDRSFGYQASRDSTFSIWGLEPGLGWLQDVAKLFAVALAIAVAFVPRKRSIFQVAALAACVVIALQVASTHWLYPYAVWFAPLVFVALFPAYRGNEPDVRASGAQL
jgi:hypothetical protein